MSTLRCELCGRTRLYETADASWKRYADLLLCDSCYSTLLSTLKSVFETMVQSMGRIDTEVINPRHKVDGNTHRHQGDLSNRICDQLLRQMSSSWAHEMENA